MTTEQLKNWIRTQDGDFTPCIRLGGVDANKPRFLGVYPAADSGPAHVCLGGLPCTTMGTTKYRLLLRWGKALPAAEAKAKALWGLFYGLSSADMDGAQVCYADPGAGPIPIGQGNDGVFEFVINLKIVSKE